MLRRQFKFGQPAGAVFQIAYTVDDLETAAANFSARLGVGPWYPLEYRAGETARYRGQPTSIRVSILRGFAGHLNVELIAQSGDDPSVYRDLIEKWGLGFHHWSVGTDDFDRDVALYQEKGYELAYYDSIPGRHRLAYMDTTRDLPGMVELCEMTPVHEDFLDRMHRASLDFDGTDIIRTVVP